MKEALKYREKLEQFIDEGQEIKILTLISKVHPDDIAELIDALEENKKTKLFRLLDVETAADVIMEIGEISREFILEDIINMQGCQFFLSQGAANRWFKGG